MAYYLVLAIVFSSLLSGCQLTPLASEYFEIPSGGVLFQDDFSDPSSGWQNRTFGDYAALDYFDGYYRIQVSGENQMVWGGTGLNFSDIRLETDAIKVIGDVDDMFGIVCRAVDQDNFYFFAISSDGYYGIGKKVKGIQSMIGAKGMLPSEVIAQGLSVNHLSVDCIGNQLNFRVNGHLVASRNDIELSTGNVGLLAGNFASQNNIVLFDNFSVINP
ncbi:MAG: hypothetical protein JSV42_06055 [Chloroflexota bacterium]|nr:MAG: hypothetical protein JSV42_06055 [Chloroflexota bacterium]